MIATIVGGLTGFVLSTGLWIQNQYAEPACYSYAVAHCMNVQQQKPGFLNVYKGKTIRAEYIGSGRASTTGGTNSDNYGWRFANRNMYIARTDVNTITGTLQTRPVLAVSKRVQFKQKDGSGNVLRESLTGYVTSKKIERDNQRHAVCIIGYNQVGVIAVNSWGYYYGDRGRFTIPYKYLTLEGSDYYTIHTFSQ